MKRKYWQNCSTSYIKIFIANHTQSAKTRGLIAVICRCSKTCKVTRTFTWAFYCRSNL